MTNDKLYRVLDANINRAMEGLRVVEEIVRFILENKKLTLEIKNLRADLKKIVSKLPKKQLLSARASLSDVGWKLYTKSEGKRSKTEELFYSNIKRSEEAVRVLEEFSKLINPKLGRVFKAIRFKLYEMEKQIARQLALDFDLYMITDPMRGHLETIKAAIAGGAKIVQLRDKYAGKNELLKIARAARALTKKHGVKLIINDYLDIAKKVDADGVHIGQGDHSIKTARRILGADRVIGVSASSLSQALKAEKEGADYIGLGPIFATSIKPEAKPVGLKALKEAVEKVKIPIVALGGINGSNIDKVLEHTKRIAVIRAVVEKKNMKQAVQALFERINEHGFNRPVR